MADTDKHKTFDSMQEEAVVRAQRRRGGRHRGKDTRRGREGESRRIDPFPAGEAALEEYRTKAGGTPSKVLKPEK